MKMTLIAVLASFAIYVFHSTLPSVLIQHPAAGICAENAIVLPSRKSSRGLVILNLKVSKYCGDSSRVTRTAIKPALPGRSAPVHF